MRLFRKWSVPGQGDDGLISNVSVFIKPPGADARVQAGRA
jgi:hypothetical protein